MNLLEGFKEDPRFWTLLVLYTVLAPLWLLAARLRWHTDRVEAVAMLLLGAYCAVNALFKWANI
jgi:hypothetical protein